MAKNCVFYDKSFFDDLYSYTYNSKESKIIYSWNGMSNLHSSDVDMTNAINFIKKNIYFTQETDVWHPVFVTSKNSYINTISLYRGATTFTPNLGVEDAVYIFRPQFQSWEINDSPFMSTDWILTSELCPFYPEYGLMFWFKRNSSSSSGLTIDEIPIGSSIRLLPNKDNQYYKIKINENYIIQLNDTTNLIKVDKDRILLPDQAPLSKKNQDFLPSTNLRYFTINNLLASNENTTKQDILFTINLDNEDPIIDSSSNVSLWIPYGDTYSYFRSPEIRVEAYENKSCSSSFISPSLSNIYREVYHALSANLNKRRIQRMKGAMVPLPNLTSLQSKLFKKICHLLATHPLIDRTTVSILRDQQIQDFIFEFINSVPRSVENEITIVKQALNIITKYFSDLNTNVNLKTNHQSTYSNGFVSTRSDLFYKIIHKYGSKLKLENISELKYREGLPNGPHIKINQEITSKCDKNLFNQTIYNNVSISAGFFNIKTNFDNTATKIILENSQNPAEKNIIPLWDIEKTKIKNIRIPITAGPDIEIDFGRQDASSIKEIEYQLPDAIEYNQKYETSIIGAEAPDILWRRVSGTDCIRFGDPKQPTLRYETATSAGPKIFIKAPGKYVLEVRVRTSFATIYDTVTIHVNGIIETKKTNIEGEDREQTEEENTIITTSYTRFTRLRPASVQYIEARRNLSIMIPNIRECYIGKQGVFWPSYTDCSVKVPQGLANPDEPPGPGNSLPPAVIPLGNNYHKFAIPMVMDKKGNKIIQNLQCPFSITYDCNNTIIILDRITLTHLSDPTEKGLGCPSLYEGIVDQAGFILDGGSNLSGFDFIDPSDNDETVSVKAPTELSTNHLNVGAYGGFSADIIKSLNINIPYHPRPGSYLKNIDTKEELLNGNKRDDGTVTHLCHDTDLSFGSPILFRKGCFHPYHGWTNSKQFNNLSSVVNFDPYNRDVQVFKGPGFHTLDNDFLDGQTRIYKSSILLKVDKIAYDPNNIKNDEDLEAYERAEVGDYITNYGYRSIGGNVSLKTLNYNDEFDQNLAIEDDNPVSSDNYCTDNIAENNYYTSYTFSRPGSLIPFKDRKSKGKRRLRWNRHGGSSIGNIEVKLNFLNYVNPKNLVIWLEIYPCANVSERLNPPPSEDGNPSKPKDPWFKDSYYQKYAEFSSLPDRYGEIKGVGAPATHPDEIKKFLYSLWYMNDNISLKGESSISPFKDDPKTPRDPVYRIYLLNQEHIEDYEYNVNIKFSDLLDIYKNASNNNYTESTLYIDNNVSNKINNTIDLSATLSAAGYSDIEVAKYKKIMIENKLCNNSHKFSKVIGMPLFSQSKESNQAPNSSDTTFTLCIAVTDESDIFEPYDRVIATQQMTGFDSCIQRNRSNLVQNSLCNWELILHRTENNHGFIPGDMLGNIKYENENPSIPGYNFIADLTDKLHLLPPSVINAPNAYTIDGRLCRYSKENINIPKYSQPNPLVIMPLLFIFPITLIGAAAGFGGFDSAMNEQTRVLVDTLNSMRTQRQRDTFNQDWYVPNYQKYPVGSSDKVLLSISKDNEMFYKLEASIFKYNNSVVMNKPKYKFYKLCYDGYLRNLSLFKSNLVQDDNFIDIFYKNYIKTLTEDGEIDPLDTKLYDDDICHISGNKDRKQVYIFVKSLMGLGGIPGKPINSFKDMLYTDNYVKYNNIFDLTKNTDNFDTLIDEKRLVVIEGLRAYYFFENNKKIVEFTPKKPEDIDTESLETFKKRLADYKTENKKDFVLTYLESQIFLLQHNILENNILNIGYIFDSESYKTILILESSAESGSIISLSEKNSNRIIVMDDEYTTIDNKNIIPLNIWSFGNSQAINTNMSEDQNISAWGVGNYGYGSNVTTRFTLSEPDIQSKIIPFIDRIHYRKNSSLDRNTCSIILDNSNTKIDGTIKSHAFIYKTNNINNSINKHKHIYIDNNINKEYGKIYNKIFKDIHFNVYEKQILNNEITEIDIDLSRQDGGFLTGTIIFDKNLTPIKIYKLENPGDLPKLKDRLLVLEDLIEAKITESKKLSKTYGIFPFSSSEGNKQMYSEKEEAMIVLRQLYDEKNNIEYYLNKLENPIDNIASIPHINIQITQNNDQSLTIKEKENKNLYWINIDPEQGCAIDKDRSPKVLKTVKFKCLGYNDIVTLNAKTICIQPSVNDIPEDIGVNESFNNNRGLYGFEYKLSDEGIEAIKSKYTKVKWPEENNPNYIIERKFFLSLDGKERAQEVIGIYEYITPIGPENPDIEPDGDLKNKVYNIFNLDNTNELYVEFKRIPRLLRNKDLEFDLYEPNNFGELTKSILPAPGGPSDSSFRVWKCIDSKTGSYVAPPNVYYQWLNEMLFRTYFGSVDGVEHRGREMVKSKDETYWIPYDFS